MSIFEATNESKNIHGHNKALPPTIKNQNNYTQ